MGDSQHRDRARTAVSLAFFTGSSVALEAKRLTQPLVSRVPLVERLFGGAFGVVAKTPACLYAERPLSD